ncbi:hydrogenase maturation peptidase HycI [Candidatus Bathyarchaeota archaeon]|nr:hydrogenase maturation peptidase HycI [Candidatus Bathyarchaeota archaeon]
MALEQELRDYLGEGERRVVLVGIGNPMRGDDGVGVRIIELLQGSSLDDVMLLNTETVPEAFTGKVEKYKPTHVLLLDAANFGGSPGDTKLIDSERIGGQAISTHSLPLNIFISYIEKSLGIEVLLLGIQPRSIRFGEDMSDELTAASKRIADTLHRILSV